MKQDNKISNAVIRRLPRYLRALEELDNKGIERISSGDLSEYIGYTASQIRQDLNHFGGFGQKGYGYNVRALHDEIENIMGLSNDYKLIIVGYGRFGQALDNFIATYNRRFRVMALFDIKPELIGREFNGTRVRNVSELGEYLKKESVDIAIMTVTKNHAQSVADELIAGGVKGLWNFTLCDLNVENGVAVEDVHLTDNLQSLVYYMNHPEQGE